MKKNIRLIIVIIKNIPKINLRYLPLLKKNKNNTKKVNTMIYENIFILTSCVNTNENNSIFINHNPNHTPEIRLSETINGLKSIRKHYKDAKIIFIESSKLNSIQKRRIDLYVDDFFDYSNSKVIRIARKHYNKGVPQFTALVKFVEENYNKYNCKTLHFLGARYLINKKEADKYSNQGSYMKFSCKDFNSSTRYFFFKNISLKSLISPFRKTLYLSILGISVEDILFRFLPNFKKIKLLAISGIVNGIEPITE